MQSALQGFSPVSLLLLLGNLCTTIFDHHDGPNFCYFCFCFYLFYMCYVISFLTYSLKDLLQLANYWLAPNACTSCRHHNAPWLQLNSSYSSNSWQALAKYQYPFPKRRESLSHSHGSSPTPRRLWAKARPGTSRKQDSRYGQFRVGSGREGPL